MSKFAWVTLATNDSYSLGALVLAHSLRRLNTAHQLAVLITPGVTETMREKLSHVFDLVQAVNVLDSRDAANLAVLARPELGITFTKLHCWTLTQYDKCVFLDADTLVVENCDELFDREEFSAAPDVGWPDCFNSGVFVYKPSDETFASLIQFAADKGSFDGGDQGLLNSYFSDWATSDSSRRLPFVYNMCSTACYSYLPAFKQFGGYVKIIHFIGASKPWMQYFDSESRRVQSPSGEEHLTCLLQIWWDIFCDKVHPLLSPSMAGLAGAFAQLTIGLARSDAQTAFEEHMRRQAWEAGHIDYLGRDSFDNIWRKITQTLTEIEEVAEGEETVPKEPKTEVDSVVETDKVVEIEKKLETTDTKIEPLETSLITSAITETAKTETLLPSPPSEVTEVPKTATASELLIDVGKEQTPKTDEAIVAKEEPEVPATSIPEPTAKTEELPSVEPVTPEVQSTTADLSPAQPTTDTAPSPVDTSSGTSCPLVAPVTESVSPISPVETSTTPETPATPIAEVVPSEPVNVSSPVESPSTEPPPTIPAETPSADPDTAKTPSSAPVTEVTPSDIVIPTPIESPAETVTPAETPSTAPGKEVSPSEPITPCPAESSTETVTASTEAPPTSPAEPLSAAPVSTEPQPIAAVETPSAAPVAELTPPTVESPAEKVTVSSEPAPPTTAEPATEVAPSEPLIPPPVESPVERVTASTELPPTTPAEPPSAAPATDVAPSETVTPSPVESPAETVTASAEPLTEPTPAIPTEAASAAPPTEVAPSEIVTPSPVESSLETALPESTAPTETVVCPAQTKSERKKSQTPPAKVTMPSSDVSKTSTVPKTPTVTAATPPTSPPIAQPLQSIAALKVEEEAPETPPIGAPGKDPESIGTAGPTAVVKEKKMVKKVVKKVKPPAEPVAEAVTTTEAPETPPAESTPTSKPASEPGVVKVKRTKPAAPKPITTTSSEETSDAPSSPSSASTDPKPVPPPRKKEVKKATPPTKPADK